MMVVRPSVVVARMGALTYDPFAWRVASNSN